MQKNALALFVLTVVGCPKKNEEAKPAPETTQSSAATEVEFPEEALVCKNGVLGVTAPPAVSGSASTSAAPITIDAGELSSLLAPIGDGGGIGLGTIGGFGHGYGGTYAITARPVGRGPRAMAVARGACGANAAIEKCRSESKFPLGVLDIELTVDGAGRATAAPKPSSFEPAFVTCLSGALTAPTYDTAAQGMTPYTLVFSLWNPRRPASPVMKGITIKEASLAVSKGLPPEVVKRIIRANFPRIRACYEVGLKRDPKLAGKVAVSFTIDSTGATKDVKLTDKSFPDEDVKTCLTKMFTTLAFPEPEGGIVKVAWAVDLSKTDP